MDFGSGDLIRAFGAFATGLGALFMGWAAIKKAKQEGKEECEKDRKVDSDD